MKFQWVISIAPIILPMLMMVSTACSPVVEVTPEPDVAADSSQQNIVHIVRYQGETLGFISFWYSGKAENWKVIADYNDGMNPNILKINQQIYIPLSIVIRDTPFSKDDLPKSHSSTSSRSNSIQPSSRQGSVTNPVGGNSTGNSAKPASGDNTEANLRADQASDRTDKLPSTGGEIAGSGKVEEEETSPVKETSGAKVSSETTSVPTSLSEGDNTTAEVSREAQSNPNPPVAEGVTKPVNPEWEAKRERLIRELLDK